MLNLKIDDISSILNRYNVLMEKTMTSNEAVGQFYTKNPLFKDVAVAIYDGKKDNVIKALNTLLDAFYDPIKLIDEALLSSMVIVSSLYDQGIIYLPNVMMSVDAMLEGIQYCKSKTSKIKESKGTIVCQVAEGDVHDIGKNIVVALLRADGFNVVDLGRDVNVYDVIAAVEKYKPILLTGTALMTTTIYSFKKCSDKLVEKGLLVPFACGGGAVNQDFVSSFSLGIYGKEASDASKIGNSILKNGSDIHKLREIFHKR